MQFFSLFLVCNADCSPTTSYFIVLCLCIRFPLIQQFFGPNAGIVRPMYSRKVTIKTVLLLFLRMLCEVRGTCFDGEYSIKNMMLRQHIFKEMKTSNSLECLILCKEDVRCQSFNYVINQDICELNNRTKEAAPRNFVQNFKRYYVGLVTNRGKSD